MAESTDTTIFLVSPDGSQRFPVRVNREVLSSKSRVFAAMLNSEEAEVPNCTDFESFVKLLKYIHSSNLKRDLREEGGVLDVLNLLKLFDDVGFDDGALSCLQYLEAVPWTVGESMEVRSVVHPLQSYGHHRDTVIARLTSYPSPDTEDSVMELMKGVTGNATFNNSMLRDEIRNLILDILIGDPPISRDGQQAFMKYAFQQSCDMLIDHCRVLSNQLTEMSTTYLSEKISQVTQHIMWLLGVMMDEKIADNVVDYWISKNEISEYYRKMNRSARCVVLMISATICIGIGSKKILAPMQARSSLLKMWLDFIYADYDKLVILPFFEKEVIEEGIGKTILTLPYDQQSRYFSDWFVKFQAGKACPNLRRAYQVWWRLSLLTDRDLGSDLIPIIFFQ
ncbi:BTB/POZ-like [Macleaya cordata]|uniref:BTB/POZ-like n=1 Tax=Macleaya cordata TaxID=56857 RepID=A0A200R6F9_MACCD|nr:BTB/POZ-like [Macleaya cordata]